MTAADVIRSHATPKGSIQESNTCPCGAANCYRRTARIYRLEDLAITILIKLARRADRVQERTGSRSRTARSREMDAHHPHRLPAAADGSEREPPL
jgi:hypothetical protein